MKKLSYDFFYIDRESLLLDLFIIAKTTWRIIKPIQTINCDNSVSAKSKRGYLPNMDQAKKTTKSAEARK